MSHALLIMSPARFPVEYLTAQSKHLRSLFRSAMQPTYQRPLRTSPMTKSVTVAGFDTGSEVFSAADLFRLATAYGETAMQTYSALPF